MFYFWSICTRNTSLSFRTYKYNTLSVVFYARKTTNFPLSFTLCSLFLIFSANVSQFILICEHFFRFTIYLLFLYIFSVSFSGVRRQQTRTRYVFLKKQNSSWINRFNFRNSSIIQFKLEFCNYHVRFVHEDDLGKFLITIKIGQKGEFCLGQEKLGETSHLPQSLCLFITLYFHHSSSLATSCKNGCFQCTCMSCSLLLNHSISYIQCKPFYIYAAYLFILHLNIVYL